MGGRTECATSSCCPFGERVPPRNKPARPPQTTRRIDRIALNDMTKDNRTQGQSRRRFLMGAGSAAVMSTVADAQPAAPGTLDETLTVLLNGRIHTMQYSHVDAAGAVVSTVSIRHNRIFAVGWPT